MNLFDGALGQLAGGGGGQGLAGLILEMLSNRQGGISGLAESFQRAGLGHIVSSWIGTGANLPVSSQQLQQVLGNEQIQALARKMGVPTETAGSQLAEAMPGVVDKLTPDGQVPQGGDLMSLGMKLLHGLLP